MRLLILSVLMMSSICFARSEVVEDCLGAFFIVPNGEKSSKIVKNMLMDKGVHYVCKTCAAICMTKAEVRSHVRTTGHRTYVPC